MAGPTGLLLDYHGVISDIERFRREWSRLLGDFLSQRFGSTPEIWREANRSARQRAASRARTREANRATNGQEQPSRNERIDWLRDVLVLAGSGVPDEDELHRTAIEVLRYVTRNTQSAVPAAATTLRILHERGFRLFTASGDDSVNLSNYLSALGVRELFEQTYGADLLGVRKDGPAFYATLLARESLDAARVIVVDDDAHRLDWARALGMNTLLVGQKDASSSHPRVQQFAELPSALGSGRFRSPAV